MAGHGDRSASIALAQIAGSRARQAIAILAIIGGFASTVFWPVSEALEPLFGWRGVLLLGLAVSGTTALGWIGVVPLLTGLMGYCPLYSVLGINTCKAK